MEEETPTVKTAFHIDKLLDYLPLIIIAIIFLVGFFTWDVVRKEMASFIMLILVFIYALWVIKVDTKSYKSWLGAGTTDNSIFPPPPNPNPFVGDWYGPLSIKISIPIALVVGIISAVAIGLGLGFGEFGRFLTNFLTNSFMLLLLLFIILYLIYIFCLLIQFDQIHVYLVHQQ